MDSHDPSKLFPGDLLADRYRIEERLGEGGFGSVYRATQLNLDRQVAIKVLHANMASRAGLGRFWREARMAQALEHPNTVRIFDFGETRAGIPYIVFQYLRGRSLDAALEQDGAMSPARTARIVTQVLKSLMEAHDAGIVHRDIKPDNIFLTDFQGEPDFVKVLDFGVAKTALGQANEGTNLTLSGEMVGTPNYMAPEQVRAQSVSPATDVYALGLVMAEMLTGQQVYTGPSAISVCFAQSSAEPVPLSREVLESPFGAVVSRATRKPIEERLQNAAEMLIELDAAVQSMERGGSSSAPPATVFETGASGAERAVRATVPTPPSPDTGGRPAPATQGSNRVVFVIVGLVVVLLGVGMAAAGLTAGRWLIGTEEDEDLAPPVVTTLPEPNVMPTSPPPYHQPPNPNQPPTPAQPPTPSQLPSPNQPPGRLAQLTPEVIRQRLESQGWRILHRSDIGPSGGMEAVLFTINNPTHLGGVWLYHFDDAGQAGMMTSALGTQGRAAYGEGHKILLIELRRDHGQPIDSAACELLMSALLQ